MALTSMQSEAFPYITGGKGTQLTAAIHRRLSPPILSEGRGRLYTGLLKAFIGIQVIPYIKCAYHYIAVGVIRHLCLQRGS